MPGDLAAAAVTVAQNTVHRGTFHCVWNLVNDDDRYFCTNKRLIDGRDLLRELKDECDRQGMKIGPKADGSIPRESVEILDQVGGYVRENADSIFDTFRLPGYSYEIQELLFTCKPHKLFAHVVEAIHRSCLEILNIANRVNRAYITATGEKEGGSYSRRNSVPEFCQKSAGVRDGNADTIV